MTEFSHSYSNNLWHLLRTEQADKRVFLGTAYIKSVNTVILWCLCCRCTSWVQRCGDMTTDAVVLTLQTWDIPIATAVDTVCRISTALLEQTNLISSLTEWHSAIKFRKTNCIYVQCEQTKESEVEKSTRYQSHSRRISQRRLIIKEGRTIANFESMTHQKQKQISIDFLRLW